MRPGANAGPQKEGPVWQPAPRPEPPAHWSKTLEVPYFILPLHQGIVEASIEFSTMRVFVGARAI